MGQDHLPTLLSGKWRVLHEKKYTKTERGSKCKEESGIDVSELYAGMQK